MIKDPTCWACQTPLSDEEWRALQDTARAQQLAEAGKPMPDPMKLSLDQFKVQHQQREVLLQQGEEEVHRVASPRAMAMPHPPQPQSPPTPLMPSAPLAATSAESASATATPTSAARALVLSSSQEQQHIPQESIITPHAAATGSPATAGEAAHDLLPGAVPSPPQEEPPAPRFITPFGAYAPVYGTCVHTRSVL